MKFFPDTFIVYTVPLKGDITYVMCWDVDYMRRWRPELISEYIKIGKGISIPLTRSLITVNTFDINGAYDKLEFCNLLNEKVEEKRFYLDRIGNKIAKQIETMIYTWEPFFKAKITKDDNFVWVRVGKRWKPFVQFLFGEEEGGNDKKTLPP